mgnify:CR=1 FL=1
MPKFVSPLARELLHGMLTTNPERRFKMKDIRSHGWMRSFSDTHIPMNIGIKIGHHNIPVDMSLVE